MRTRCIHLARGVFRRRLRFLILFVSWMSASWAHSLDVVFNMSIVCINKPNAPPVLSHIEVTSLLTGSGVGALVAALPFCLLLNRWGGRLTFALYLGLGGVSAIIFPFILSVGGVWAVFCLRMAHGAALGAVFPMLGYVAMQWSPEEEHTVFIALFATATQVGRIVANFTTGSLCGSVGWQVAYWVLGGSATASALLFFFIFRDRPERHPLMTVVELCHIRAMGSDSESSMARRLPSSLVSLSASINGESPQRNVPYGAIFSSLSIWAIWFAALGGSFGTQVVLQFMPTFLVTVLAVSPADAGPMSAIPLFAQLIAKLACIPLSKKCCQCLSDRWQLRIYSSLALWGSAVALTPLGFIRGHSTWSVTSAILCFAIGVGLVGFETLGCIRSARLVSQEFSPFVLAMMQQMMAVAMILTPILVHVEVPEKTHISGWQDVFVIVALLMFVANLSFVCFCEADPALFVTKTKFQERPTSSVDTAEDVPVGQMPLDVRTPQGAQTPRG